MSIETQTDLFRDERDKVAAAAIQREAQRWGHNLAPSLIALFAARALDAADRLDASGETQ